MDVLVLRMYAYVCEYVKAGGNGSPKHSVAVTVVRGEEKSRWRIKMDF